MYALRHASPRRRLCPGVALLAAALLPAGCGAADQEPDPPGEPASEIEVMTNRFAPVEIAADISQLPAAEVEALAELLEAAAIMDGLFLEQVWAGNPSQLVRLAADRTPRGIDELHYFLINKGPWSRLDHNAPFLGPGAAIPPKPPQANFYPADATREEVERWFDSLSGAARQEATGFFSIIARQAGGGLTAVPYSVHYRNALAVAAEHLRRAAALTTQPTLQRYLELRADAFQSNDYYDSDVAWMELESSIEPTIGPYETYEDEWFGYKAAFEAFITLRDDAETGKLAAFGAELQGLEDTLPIDPRYRNPALGALAPIRVVNVIFTAGDANSGVQTAAFNLPNDERVTAEKGSKRTMLKNVQEAKFRNVLVPISRVALSTADQARVSFEAFFTHILMHELMHGLGPHQISGTSRTVREAMTDANSALEEAKADISGLWALQQLADKGVIAPDIAESMYVTFLASTFRSIRFGVNEAHGKGIAVQLNYLLDHGAVVVQDDGTFTVVDERIRGAVEALTRDILTMQATGDRDAAVELLGTMGVIRPEVQRVLDQLTDVPVDIEPLFVTARQVRHR
jgi:hypothetical protein